MSALFGKPLSVLNAGIGSFADAIEQHDGQGAAARRAFAAAGERKRRELEAFLATL